MKITQTIAKRLPDDAAGHRARRRATPRTSTCSADRVREHVDGLDGVLHSIGFAPEAALGGNFLKTEWDDVATARAGLGVLAQGPGGRGAAADAPTAARSSGSPSTRPWPGRSTTGWAWPRRRSSRRRATWRATSGPKGIRVNLVAAGPMKTTAAKSIPGFEEFEDVWADAGAARLGRRRPRAGRARLRRAAVGLVPAHHRRDRARRRRRARHGRLTGHRDDRGLGRRRRAGAGRAAGARRREPLLPATGGEADARPVSAAGARRRPGTRRRRGSWAGRPRDRGARAPGCGSGSPPRSSPESYAAWPRGGHDPAGGAQPADRATCTGSSSPSRGGGAARPRRSVAPSPTCSTRLTDGDVAGAVARGRAGRSRRRGGPAPTTRTPHVPVVAVTGHERQDHDLADGGPDGALRRATSSAGRRPTASTSTVSWSRPATSPVRAGRAGCSTTRGCELAVTETARGGILLRGLGVGAHRRLRRHQRQRRPPRACRASTPSTSSPR